MIFLNWRARLKFHRIIRRGFCGISNKFPNLKHLFQSYPPLLNPVSLLGANRNDL